ncbi:MAG: helix-hairpin-helix domain-containing protein [Planctomycetes bacterium]|nr:helix-hairpin-helix domain-containing protein [Planctomycetota bacterium]
MSDGPRQARGTWLVIGLLSLAVGSAAWLRLNRPVLNTAESAGSGDRGRGSFHWPDSRIDINSAGLAQLDLLPGIGPGLAQRIVADRLTNGWFTSVDDLTRVPGIGPRIIERIRPFAVAEALDLQASGPDASGHLDAQ